MAEENLVLKINQKIEIIEDNVTYKSIIQDVKSDTIMITMPMSDSKYYIMHRGSILQFYVTGEKEIYLFKSEVIGNKMDNNVQLAILSTPEFLKKVQRREYFRLPVALPTKYFMLSNNSTNSNLADLTKLHSNKMHDGIIIDISGGGMKLAIREPVLLGHYLVVNAKIPTELNLLCKVVWVDRDNINRNYKVALQFEGISERDRDKIIKFIFEKMRNQSKIL